MAITFPKNPQVDELYTDDGLDRTYRWDGVKWNFVDTEMELYSHYSENPFTWLSNDGNIFVWDDM